MKRQILKIQKEQAFPFCWVKFDSDHSIDFQGYKMEIYLKKDFVNVSDMKSLFYDQQIKLKFLQINFSVTRNKLCQGA